MYIIANCRKTSRRLMLVLCLILAAVLLAAPSVAAAGIKNGLLLCFNAIIPSLFPFLFIVDYIFAVISGSKSQRRWPRILAAVVFGICGGTPMGAKALAKLVGTDVLEPETASRLLAGSVNAGPAFLISAVGAGLFGNIRAGVILLAALTAASLGCTGLAVALPRRLSGGKKTHGQKKPAQFTPANFAASMSSALDSIMRLCAYIVFFCCVGAYIEAACQYLSLSPILSWAAKTVMDLAGACAAAAEIGSVAGLYLAAVSVSLCGISVLLQVGAIIKGTGITARYLFMFRPLHTALTLLFLRLLIPMFPDVSDVIASQAAYRIYSLSPVFSVFFVLTALIFVFGDRRKSLFTNAGE